ncbi:MAG: GNAT family protein [Dehalococcoidia bacterium]
MRELWYAEGRGEIGPIEGAWLRLRPVEERDLPALMAWVVEPEVLYWWDDEMADLAETRTEFLAPDDGGPREGYIIEEGARGVAGRPVGYIQWWHRSYDPHYHWTAGIDIFIGEPDARERGVGTEAVRMLLGYLFEVRKLHRVTIDPESGNARAIRSYQKAGFRLDGLLRHNEFIRGEYIDTQMLAILEDEWPAAKALWESERGKG